MSHFLPGGGAEMGANPFEKFYFVLEGEITCSTDVDGEITLKKGEGVFFGPNENRAILNKSNYPCTTLVIYNYA
jgi:quercetin dioxygenase-like cupin family protein